MIVTVLKCATRAKVRSTGGKVADHVVMSSLIPWEAGIFLLYLTSYITLRPLGQLTNYEL